MSKSNKDNKNYKEIKEMEISTPFVDYVKNYIAKNPVRAHMPGHKGVDILGFEKYDITEIAEELCLYQKPEGVLKESMENASHVFGTGETLYSAEGSSLAIKTMLATVLTTSHKLPKKFSREIFEVKPKSTSYNKRSGENDKVFRRPYILSARNVHKAFLDGCALLDLDVTFLYPESGHICESNISPESVDRALEKAGDNLPIAVYVTSPDYLGCITDIKGIADVCKAYDLPLLVDNAHGAYLHFLEESLHPMQLGAAMCADSAHKTLPAITGAGYLHISGEYADRFRDAAYEYMSMFASTSPSFLISMSLDNCNCLLSKTFKKELMQCINKLNQLKIRLLEQGISVRESEPLKLVAEHNMGKDNALRELKKFNVYPEFTDDNYVVFMISPYNSDEELMSLEDALIALSKCNNQNKYSIPIYRAHEAKRVISIREAAFSKKELIPVRESLGRIYADTSVSCPPAVPIAICGELIDEEMIKAFQDYNIENVRVVIDLVGV